MSRSNPGKQKPRTTRATAQIVCEGFTEEAFCKHLKSLYARDCGVRVTIHNVPGGSPQDLIQAALQRKGYDRTLVFYDADRPLPETWQKKSIAARHLRVISNPCVEGLLLAILSLPIPDNTAACKKAIGSILPDSAKYDPRPYAATFPKPLLDACTHPHLLTLRSLFQPAA